LKQSIVNSRPLTYQSLSEETEEPLTPNRILHLGGQIVYAAGIFKDEDISKRKWRFSQQLADEFWTRWIRHYLPVLTKRTKWFEDEEEVKINDIVILIDDTAPRNAWRRGKVTSVHPGVDCKVRSVTVKTATGEYKRPVTKVAVIPVGN
jgi:hypothetical protein